MPPRNSPADQGVPGPLPQAVGHALVPAAVDADYAGRVQQQPTYSRKPHAAAATSEAVGSPGASKDKRLGDDAALKGEIDQEGRGKAERDDPPTEARGIHKSVE